MASTFGEIVAHVSSASDTSESVFVTGSEHPKSLTFLHNNHSLLAQSLQTMCVFFLSCRVTVNHVLLESLKIHELYLRNVRAFRFVGP